MNKKNRKTLSTQYLLRINNIFEKNKWIIECSEDKNMSQFNRFCQRVLDIGENKKRDLFLELSERYLWLTQEHYLECLIAVLKKLVNDIDKDVKIFVMPLIAPEDVGKAKSSMFLTYLFNDVKIRYDSVLGKYKYEMVYDVAGVCRKMKQEKSLLVLVDDFIGTGNTAEKCLNSMDLPEEIYARTKVLALVAQEEGIEYIEKLGIEVFAGMARKKGISDYYDDEEAKKRIEMMDEIEEKMSVKKDYRLGYGKSEALVTMCRTPNNTFPVFWEEKGNMKLAPFPRG
ncbi:MAG: hypothetical protein IJA10_04515 [Lachnospiraceae bacterium]|nr:hypothetical protein [Lachnospiraceae bacterium]